MTETITKLLTTLEGRSPVRVQETLIKEAEAGLAWGPGSDPGEDGK